MFWMMNDWNRGMGPRGPMYGHRGFGHRGFLPGGLFLLPALLFGGWMIIAVAGSLIGAAVMLLGSIFSGIAAVADGIFSAAFAGGDLIIGFVLGMSLYFWARKKKAARSEG